MRLDALGAGTTLGYCTNVHAGTTLAEVMAALDKHACRVRERLGAKELGIGLWLSASALPEARAAPQRLADWLGERGLRVFTLNGFPQGDFHQRIVKHAVYEPTWADPARLAYTLDLARMLAALVPAGTEASISTLPVAWGGALDAAGLDGAAAHAAACARALADLETETGVLVHVDFEPEPGCHFDTAPGAVAWLERVAGAANDEAVVRRHLRLCHDICHSAVMFEPQEAAFDTYAKAGVAVGKVQVSAAIAVAFAEGADGLCAPDRTLARAQLADFAEERYLHQTVVRRANGTTRLIEDLPLALASDEATGDDWRVHFHVPVFLERIGVLHTTHDEIATAVRRAKALGTRHFELETYAWDVLPESAATDDLGTGIARELAWVAAECAGEGAA